MLRPQQPLLYVPAHDNLGPVRPRSSYILRKQGGHTIKRILQGLGYAEFLRGGSCSDCAAWPRHNPSGPDGPLPLDPRKERSLGSSGSGSTGSVPQAGPRSPRCPVRFFVCAVSGPLILLLRPAFLPLASHCDLVGESRTRGLFRVGAESYALMSVFGFLCMAKLPRRSGLVKSCSLCRHWRRLAEPMVIMLSSAGWVPPDQIRCGLASL
jgi:hypothetical protein